MALNNLSAPLKRFVVRLSHEQLPTNHFLHNQHPDHPELCPFCQRFNETTPHVLRCPHPQIRNRQQELLDSLNAIHKKFKCPATVSTSLTQGITQWLTSEDHPGPAIPHVQSQIGWDQIFYGRVSHHWVKEFIRLRPNVQLSYGQRWMSRIIRTLWDHSYALWRQRCDFVHASNPGPTTLPTILHTRIRSVYADALSHPSQETLKWTRTPLDTLLQRPTHELKRWLHYARQSVQTELQHQITRATQHQADIRTFFPRVNIHSPPLVDPSTYRPP